MALNVTSVDPIQLAEVATEKVKIFIAELTPEEKKAAKYEVIFAPTDESQQVKVGADAEGNVAVSDLISAITSFYGKRPVERTLVTTVNAYVLQDGVAVRKQGTINVLATPPGVVIENAYYLIGDCNGWSRDKVAEYKFNHSDADVYDDPVFTITVPAPVDETSGERKDFYFNIVPESSMALEDGGFWPSLIGSDLENGDDRTEAGLSVKIDGQDNAFMQHAEDGAKFYTITLNTPTAL